MKKNNLNIKRGHAIASYDDMYYEPIEMQKKSRDLQIRRWRALKREMKQL